MQEKSSRIIAGVDIGTVTVRAVVGNVDDQGEVTIVGVGEADSKGMRKGIVAKLDAPSVAIDQALGKVERMCGQEIDRATININGASILSTEISGMVALGIHDGVTDEDLARLEEVATTGKIPANREILSVVAHDYVLDGQGGIKDPIGMSGARLEINASVISAMTPHVENLQKVAEGATLSVSQMVVSSVAAAEAVLSETQRENGVMVLDMGGSTTSMAIFEEGDLQYVSVLPVGAINITNDLAVGLETTPEIAEVVKLEHASAIFRDSTKRVSVKVNSKTHEFSLQDIDEIVEARLEEMFEEVYARLKAAGYAGKLPNGVVLTGGGAKLKGIDNFAKNALRLVAEVKAPLPLKGIIEKVDGPEFATAVGLMLLDQKRTEDWNGNFGHDESSGGGLFGRIKRMFGSR